MKYDIFISYRREGGNHTARTIKTELERRGYSVFLDFDELTDGVFDTRVLDAISSAPIFMIILSPHALDRCINENDWVRKEIEFAVKKGKHIIPVNPDSEFKDSLENLPELISEAVGRNQHSEIMLGSLFRKSVDKLIEDRIKTIIKYPRQSRRRMIPVGVAAVLILAGAILWGISAHKNNVESEKAKKDSERYYELVSDAKKAIRTESTAKSAEALLDEADSIYSCYQDSKYRIYFNSDSEIVRWRVNSVLDSLYIKYKNNYDKAMSAYLDQPTEANKQVVVGYIDNALSFRFNQDLFSMRNSL